MLQTSSRFTVSNIEEVIEEFTPLITKLSYQLYSQYNSVIDFNDARQEILICLYRCLLHYDSQKSKFITYFICSANKLRSRFYYEYFNAIELKKRSVELNFDMPALSESYIRIHLSDESKEIYDVFEKEQKVSSWIISRNMDISRYSAEKKYENFKKEVAKVVGI